MNEYEAGLVPILSCASYPVVDRGSDRDVSYLPPSTGMVMGCSYRRVHWFFHLMVNLGLRKVEEDKW